MNTLFDKGILEQCSGSIGFVTVVEKLAELRSCTVCKDDRPERLIHGICDNCYDKYAYDYEPQEQDNE